MKYHATKKAKNKKWLGLTKKVRAIEAPNSTIPVAITRRGIKAKYKRATERTNGKIQITH